MSWVIGVGHKGRLSMGSVIIKGGGGRGGVRGDVMGKGRGRKWWEEVRVCGREKALA